MNDIFAIIGPTASGKSSVADSLIDLYNFSIVNFDSCQMVSGLDVLKAMPERYFEHYLYGIYSQKEDVNVFNWCNLALEQIKIIENKGRKPILVGGSGFYLKSLINGVCQLPIISSEIFQYVQNLDDHDCVKLLEKYDYESFVKYKDLRRIRKSLCVYLSSGKSISYFYNNEIIRFDISNVHILALIPDKKKLEDNIKFRLNRDFDKMVAEVIQCNEDLSAHVIGVKEIKNLLSGEINKEKCVELILYRTRQYAKRQITFIKNSLYVKATFNDSKILRNYILNFAQ